jgi:hypothetical protein
MRRLHLAAGGATLVIFLLTGAYMRFHEPPVGELAAERHLMFLSRHIYILAAAVANLLLGAYVSAAGERGAAWLQRAGSALLVACAGLLVAAFVHEPVAGRPRTLASTLGLYALLGGTLLHVMAGLWAARARRAHRPAP